MSGIVRPNRWDSRERLEDLLGGMLDKWERMHPEDFIGHTSSKNLDIRVTRRRAIEELDNPPHSDLERRVRHPLVRLWREWRAGW